MLYVSSILLLLVNAVTWRRVRNLYNRVAILIILFYGIIWCDNLNIALLDTWEGIYDGLFHSTSITHSFALFLCIIRAIVFFSVYYPRRLKKSMGATARKISSLLLTQYIDSCLEIFLNNIIKMWEQFRILEFPFIILLIGEIFLISSSDLVFSELSTTVELLFTSYSWLLAAFVPIKIYSNTEADKDKILSENKNKSGIYMWKNNINKKKYVGSSENLRRRFREYFNINHLIRYNCMHICRALLKHEYSNFSLTILEYCEREKLLIREKHYWNIFNPEYNISQDPTAPMSGRNHSEESKTKISDSLTGENNPMFGKNHSDKTKQILSDANIGENNPMFGKTKENNPMFNKPRPEGAGMPSQAIEVTDSTNNTTTSYNSMREAARVLNINQSSIFMFLKNNQVKPYKGKYTFKKI